MAIDTAFPSQATPAPRVIQGEVTWDLNTKERMDVDLPSRIHALEAIVPGAPILGLMNRIGSPQVKKQPIFYMFQLANLKDFITGLTLEPAAETDFALAFAAEDLAILKKGFHLINTRTREIIRCEDDALAVVRRATGTVAATDTAVSDEWAILNYASAEGDSRHQGVLRQPTMIFNYNGEFQDSYEVTQVEDGSSKREGSARADARMDKLEQARKTLEMKTLFDQRTKFLNEDGKTVWVPNGLDAICTENETDFGGTVTEALVLTAAESINRYGPSTRWVMSSPKFVRTFGQLFTGQRRWDGAEKLKYAGVHVLEYQANSLKLNFFEHKLLQDSVATHANAMNGTAYVCNFERGGKAPGFALTTMKGSINGFFKWFLNLQFDGARKIVDQLVVNYGFSYTFAEHFARWMNP